MRISYSLTLLRRWRTPLLLFCTGFLLIHILYFSRSCDLPPFPGCHHSYFKPRPVQQFSLDYAYIHDARNVCSDFGSSFAGGLTRTDIVILILTMSQNVDERNAVRETYGSVARGQPWPAPAGQDVRKDHQTQKGKVRVVFLMGQSTNKSFTATDDEILRQESSQFGDIVQWDGLEETYPNLTLKVLLGFRWVKHHCPRAQYVVKTDESTFIHIPRLFRRIETTDMRLNELAASGVFPAEAIPHKIHSFLHKSTGLVARAGKFAVSTDAYPFCSYPVYGDGPFYFMHISLAMRILSLGKYLPYINIEDAHNTGVAACAARIGHVTLGAGEYFPCQNGRRCDFVTDDSKMAAKDTPPEIFREIWRTLSDPSLCSAVELTYLRTFDYVRQYICSTMMHLW